MLANKVLAGEDKMVFSLLNLLLVAFIVAIVMLFVTQVLMPTRLGTPIFPLFRIKSKTGKAVSKAERDLETTAEEALLQERLDEINRRKAQLKVKK